MGNRVNHALLRNFLYLSMFLWRMFSSGPRRRLNSSRPMERSLHLVTARTLACLTVFFMSAISPKYSFSLYLNTTSCLLALRLNFSATKFPSMTKYKRSPSSPSFTTYSLGANISSLRASHNCCFSQSCTSQRISIRPMTFSYSVRLRMADSCTMFIKVSLSSAKIVPDLVQRMLAARLALYMRDSSPKSYPVLYVLRQVGLPLMILVHSYQPEAITYSLSPASPSRMISFSGGHFTSSIAPTTTAILSSDRLWNIMDFFSNPRMSSADSLLFGCC